MGSAAAGAQTAPPTSAPSAGPAAEDPVVTAAVRKQYFAWQSGTLDRAAYSDEANKQFAPGLVSQISSQLQQLGDPTVFIFLGRKTQGEYRIYSYEVDTPKAKLRMAYALDAAGKIAGIQFAPAS